MFYLQVLGFAPTITLHNGMDLKEEPVHCYDVGDSDGEITTMCGGDLTGTEIIKHCDHNSSEIPAVTVEEAIHGLITVIHYLQAHPPGQDIQILFDLLDVVNKQASHAAVERGLQANSNDQANDIHSLQINKTCKRNMKIEPVTIMESVEQMHDSSDVTSLEHATPNVRFKRKTSQKDVNTSTICATHDAIPEQLEPDVPISSQKQERISNELSEELHTNQDAITLRGNDINIIKGVSVSSLYYLSDSHQRTEHIEDEAHCKNKMKNSTKAFKCGEEMSKQIHQCKICDFQCENPKKLFQHAKGHRKYNCKECGRSSTSKAGLVRHMLRHRNKKLQESNIGDIVDNTKKTSSLYQCKSCDFQCEERKELWDHKLSHSEYVCKACGYICRYKSVFAKHMKIHEKKVSLSRNKLTSPMPQKPIISKIKSTSYMSPKDMFHINEKMHFYKCKLCDYHCVNRRKVRYHAESHRDYTCKVCGKKSASKSALSKHMPLHDKEPLLPCQYCKQGFKDAEQLTEHLKIHSGKSIVCGVSVVCGEC